MESLELAMQSLGINSPEPNPSFQQHQIIYTETMSETASCAQNEVSNLDEDMARFFSETHEIALHSKELSELLDQMQHVREWAWSLEARSSEIAEQFANLLHQINARKCDNMYLPGLTISFKEDDELKDAVFELQSHVRKHMFMLEQTRKKQVELLMAGYQLQATIGFD
ncbi:hypothetical protein N7454_000250 [Penicillium verhagenii]|nr:hypothetical protein N7454_000250 [Penicillium verhagenii]